MEHSKNMPNKDYSAGEKEVTTERSEKPSQSSSIEDMCPIWGKPNK